MAADWPFQQCPVTYVRYPTIDQPTTPLDGSGLPYQRLDAPLSAFAQPAGNLAQATDLLALGAQQYRQQ
jgi:hypothetical protein